MSNIIPLTENELRYLAQASKTLGDLARATSAEFPDAACWINKAEVWLEGDLLGTLDTEDGESYLFTPAAP